MVCGQQVVTTEYTPYKVDVRNKETKMFAFEPLPPQHSTAIGKLIRSLLLSIFNQTRAATSMSGQHALACLGGIDLGLSLVLGLLALRLTINASIIAPPLNSERTESITFTPHPTPAIKPGSGGSWAPKTRIRYCSQGELSCLMRC